jgi:exopolysaccharide biosynthesis polyprenyl glycosylphosphotransferase
VFKRFNANYLALFLLFDLFLLQLALLAGLSLRYNTPIGEPWPHITVQNVRLELHLAVALLGVAGFISLSVYNPRKVMRWVDELQRVVLANTVVAFSLMGALYLLNVDVPRLGFFYFYIISTVLLVSYRLVLRAFHRLRQHHPDALSRVLIVGAGRTGRGVVNEFREHRWPGLELVGFMDDDPEKVGQEIDGLPVLGAADRVKEIVQEHHVDEVIIALPSQAHERLNGLVAMLWDQPLQVRVVPDFFDLAFHNATVESIGGVLLIGLRDPAIDGAQRLMKRLMDIVLSALSLVIMSPIFLIATIAIKLHDGGPVFYRSERIGENGRTFRMFKFRSMKPDADKDFGQVAQRDEQGNIIHKHAEDPRVTRVGRWLRRTSIDELPQLINVLKGEMSLVGPRPELPWMVEKYQLWQRKRFAVPQGMTGWWQINGRSEAPMHLYTEHDLYYIQHYSLWLDIRILWKTLGVIITGRGAY